MNEHDRRLKSLQDPPVHESDRPPPTVDPDKLLHAWNEMTGVLRDLVAAIRSNELDNDRTRRDNRNTRLVVVAATLAGAGLVAGLSVNNYLTIQSMRVAAEEDRQLLMKTAEDSSATLKAMRSIVEAVGAKVEADTTGEAPAQEEARVKAIEARVQVMRAQAEVEEDAGKVEE